VDWVQDGMYWLTVNTVIMFRERMFKNATLLTLKILFLDVSYYIVCMFFSFVSLFLCFFVTGVFFLHSYAVSVFGLLAVVPGH
jgi:hypothetical protein